MPWASEVNAARRAYILKMARDLLGPKADRPEWLDYCARRVAEDTYQAWAGLIRDLEEVERGDKRIQWPAGERDPVFVECATT